MGDAWEQRTRETDLPRFACNRTGTNPTLHFTPAESVAVKDGTRLLSFHAPDSTLILVDWDIPAREPIGQKFLPLDLPESGADSLHLKEDLQAQADIL